MLTPLNAYKAASEIDVKLVNELRSQFLSEANQNADQYNSQDIDRVKSDDWQVQRFLIVNKKKVDDALKMMINAMKWRKSFGVLSIKETDLPQEYYKASTIFRYGKDRNGANVIVFRANIHKRIEEWDPILKKFVVFLLEIEDQNFDGNGVTLLFDNSGSGVSNLDMDLLQFIISLVRDYYPKLVSALITYEMPWILQYVVKLVKSWLPEEQKKIIYLTTKKDINDYVAQDQLPVFMGGTNALPIGFVPNGVITAQELAEKYGIKKKSVDDLLALLSKSL